MNITGAKRRIGYKGDLRVPYAFAGWNDALNNRPFNYSIVDSAPSSYLAIAYESARLRVLALRMAGLPVPKWNTPNSVPPRVHGAFSQANELNKAARIDGAIIYPIGALACHLVKQSRLNLKEIMTMTYFAEYTDTFGGEANYCWVKRAYIEADSLKSALRRARRQFSLSGVRGDITANYGDEAHWTPRRSCTVLMVRWDDTPPESGYDCPRI